VVIGILGVLVAVLLPSLAGARRQAHGVKCLSNLHVFGQGLTIYLSENKDMLVPGRLPRVDDCTWAAEVVGGRKYRPTFLVMMSREVGADPFADPQECRNTTDRFGEPGDQQDYASPVYVCPAVVDWTDERNGSYGYNYQFLGNSRLRDSKVPTSFKNWPVFMTDVRTPADTVCVADSMGTAASFAPTARKPYGNNDRDVDRLGNEGFNLDPPCVDVKGEMADLVPGNAAGSHRSAADPRHDGKANVLWLDTHAEAADLRSLGYELSPEDIVLQTGNNTRWSVDRRTGPWLAQ
jgi:prepilin-type processing-associated H-X9-DG protein